MWSAIIEDDTVRGGTGWGANSPSCATSRSSFSIRRGWAGSAGLATPGQRRISDDPPVIAHPHFTGTGTRLLEHNGGGAIDDFSIVLSDPRDIPGYPGCPGCPGYPGYPGCPGCSPDGSRGDDGSSSNTFHRSLVCVVRHPCARCTPHEILAEVVVDHVAAVRVEEPHALLGALRRCQRVPHEPIGGLVAVISPFR